MYISMAQKYIMKHSQQNMLSNKNPPTLIPKTIPKLQNSLKVRWYHGFSLKACSELQNKERETRLKRAIKGINQGKSIWLEAYTNKIA